MSMLRAPHVQKRRAATIIAAALALAVLITLVIQNWPSQAESQPGEASTSTAPVSDPGQNEIVNPERTRSADELAPETIAPVDRGEEGARTAASTGDRNTPARYPDGVSVQLTSVQQAVIEDRGPGAFAGDPVTLVSLSVANDSPEALVLDHVVVTLVYGDPARVAKPVYTESTADFGGSVKGGESSTAVYGFSVPEGDGADATLHVDIDAAYQPAVIAGNLTS